MRKTALLALFATVAVASPFDVANAAQTLCKDRKEIVDLLSRRFGETQRSFGLQNDRKVLELYASENGTWTALVTLPSGRSCVVAAGEAWHEVEGEPAPVGEPA
ncbi:hypothetical protein [Acuticoccus mangrovi]|uniref:Uncharacterized protein n=1 Tax=Acuticoccus mangrovi TaxID=2796142 RepID=A0A934ILH8_9HYPH|nr:hypothetical protein [Acuticoccus mangrovi]MBJ3774120.1 hypothetical protein [Acuticoccus mangrovi]